MSNRDLDKIEPAREPLDIAQDVPTYSFFGSTLPNDTGIYLIYNDLTHNFYVGGASGKYGFRQRFKGHRKDIRNGNHHNPHLQRAIEFYGHENFSIRLIEFCPSEKCNEREQYYLDTLDHHYNIAEFVGTTKNVPRSPEFCERVREIHSRDFEIYHPKKGVITGFNLSAYCRKNDLDQRGMWSVIRGDSIQHRGYFKTKESYEKYMKDLEENPPSSFYRGVSWAKHAKIWVAITKKQGKKIHIGYYKNEFDAAEAAFIGRQVYEVTR